MTNPVPSTGTTNARDIIEDAIIDNMPGSDWDPYGDARKAMVEAVYANLLAAGLLHEVEREP